MPAEPGEGPVRSTGTGSWPGTDLADALKIAFAEAPELPYLPELPDRGAPSALVGRGAALLAGLAVDLQPAGWRLADAPGRDHRTARATLRSDLDQLEEQAQGYVGPFQVSVAGPATLAASLELPRGGLVLADPGARRDVAQSLAEGLTDLAGELRRRLPSLDLVLRLDEPLLPAVLAGTVPTASGLNRHRALDRPVVAALVDEVAGRPGAPVWVHCCADGVPLAVLRQTAVAGLSVDVDRLRPADWDQVADGLGEGWTVALGVVPAGRTPSPDELADRALRPLRDLGLGPEVASQVVLTPAGGLAGRSRDDAVRVLRALRTAAGIVTDQLPA